MHWMRACLSTSKYLRRFLLNSVVLRAIIAAPLFTQFIELYTFQYKTFQHFSALSGLSVFNSSMACQLLKSLSVADIAVSSFYISTFVVNV